MIKLNVEIYANEIPRGLYPTRISYRPKIIWLMSTKENNLLA